MITIYFIYYYYDVHEYVGWAILKYTTVLLS